MYSHPLDGLVKIKFIPKQDIQKEKRKLPKQEESRSQRKTGRKSSPPSEPSAPRAPRYRSASPHSIRELTFSLITPPPAPAPIRRPGESPPSPFRLASERPSVPRASSVPLESIEDKHNPLTEAIRRPTNNAGEEEIAAPRQPTTASASN